MMKVLYEIKEMLEDELKKTCRQESISPSDLDEMDKMVDIIKDGNANWLARIAAIDEVKSHCSEEKFKELKGVVDGLTDDKASQLKSAYEGKAK